MEESDVRDSGTAIEGQIGQALQILQQSQTVISNPWAKGQTDCLQRRKIFQRYQTLTADSWTGRDFQRLELREHEQLSQHAIGNLEVFQPYSDDFAGLIAIAGRSQLLE